MNENEPANRYRFGVFEADLDLGELRRHGSPVRLPAQPFQVLCILLARPGEMVTREELARQLWPDGTFVDFEHGLNSAVNRIREAIGDTARNPRFVQTLARRGYRFIAPVERLPQTQGPVSAEVAALAPAPPEKKKGLSLLATLDDLPVAPSHVVQTLFVLLQIMYLSFYVGALANMPEIEQLIAPLPIAPLLAEVILVSAAIAIPARAFALLAVVFRAPAAPKNILRLWPFLLGMDILWSLSPFLLLHHISFGLAVACTALLVYSPFAQRSLVLMGAGRDRSSLDT